MRTVALLVVLVFLAFSPASRAFDPFVIEDIRIEGSQRITPGTIFNYLPLQVGDTLDDEKASAAIRDLFATGFFNDIQLGRQGDILVITVQERPAIASINISGNKEIDTDTLLGVLQRINLVEGEVLDRLQLDRISQELTRQYYSRGKYNVQIETQVTPLERNRVEISIDISEGRAARIRQISIVGNEAFSDEQIRNDFESGTGGVLSFYTHDDQYSREKLQGDLELLMSYYQDRGYVDFGVESTQVSISPDKKDIYVTVNVSEGEPYRIGEITIAGDPILDPDRVRLLLLMQENDLFSRKAVEQTTQYIQDALAVQGYAFANVNPIPNIDRENRVIDLTLFIDPGKRVYVRRVNFTGNIITSDDVLRREVRQLEGGWFSSVMVEESRLRLQRLGYFEHVEVETPAVPGSDDQVDIEFMVQERSAGNLSFGLGASQLEGLIVTLAVTQDNVFGSGKRVGFSVNASKIFKRIDLAYFNPYWTQDGISRGFNFSYREFDQAAANISSYSSNSLLAAIRFGVPVSANDRIPFSFAFEDTEINASVQSSQQVLDFLAENGTRFKMYKFEIGWARDSRDHFFTARRGSLQSISFETALPFSDVEWYKITYRLNKYWPVRSSMAFAVRTEVGYGEPYGDTSTFPFFENYYAGGPRSVRGFDDNTLGPKDEFGRPLGGAFKWAGGGDLYFPIPFLPNTYTTRLSWFVDFGQVYRDVSYFEASELRYSTGISFQWLAPVGPLILNVAQTFNGGPLDRTESFQFLFGTTF